MAELSTEDIRGQLGRILGSPEFQRSARLRDLLEYLVSETVEGRGDKIKAVSIAIDLYGRDENFDAQNDTIVRVEAGRLRRKLEEFYRQTGSGDPLLIEVPKGAYRPRFKLKPVTGRDREASSESQPIAASRDQRLLYITAAITLLTLGLVIWILQSDQGSPDKERTSSPVAPAPEVLDRPYLMVLPIENLDESQLGDRLVSGTTEALIANLAKLSGLSVMAHASVLELDQEQGKKTVPSGLGVTHVFHGSLAMEREEVWLNLQLIDPTSGLVIWADRWAVPQGDIASLEESLALRIATELSVHIEPDERARLASRHAVSHEALVYYRQALIMLIPPNEMTRVETARNLFLRAQELDAGFAGGCAGESFSHSITVLFLKADDPDEELAKALSLAQQAIEIDPQFGMGYATLSFAQLFSGDTGQALVNARKAVEIQPGDAFAKFILGMNLIIAGQPEDSFQVLKSAIRLDPIEPRTPYLNVLGIGYFAAGRYQQAIDVLEQNLRRGGPRGPHMDIFIAAAYAKLGNEADARELTERISTDYPGFPVEGWLSHWLGASGQLSDVMLVLRDQGLPGE